MISKSSEAEEKENDIIIFVVWPPAAEGDNQQLMCADQKDRLDALELPRQQKHCNFLVFYCIQGICLDRVWLAMRYAINVTGKWKSLC